MASWLPCFVNETVNGTFAVLPSESHRDCSAKETRREGHHKIINQNDRYIPARTKPTPSIRDVNS